MAKNKFIKWLDTFLSEKKLDDTIFEVEHKETLHLIESDLIIELIKKSSEKEQKQIKKTIVQIDFTNGNINHYFKFLARCYVENNF